MWQESLLFSIWGGWEENDEILDVQKEGDFSKSPCPFLSLRDTVIPGCYDDVCRLRSPFGKVDSLLASQPLALLRPISNHWQAYLRPLLEDSESPQS